MIHGSCLCGATAFEIDGALAPGSLCHCSQCRRQTSHVYASTHVPDSALRLTRAEHLRWYRASPAARRGFCGQCGSVLFWDPADEAMISVSLGALQPPHPGQVARHIFTGDAPGYYPLDDGLPKAD
ncbi:GFA family protein [Marinibacterium sp. SX1]|uniref:GFA family protein n=1 Tax=Marinibacterium sp. SX1 TaxID=3388424 RepID=UPI003D173663